MAAESELHAERTFFGTYRVNVDRTAARARSAHGTTLHGKQLHRPERRGNAHVLPSQRSVRTC
jgi:hypothetical protein